MEFCKYHPHLIRDGHFKTETACLIFDRLVNIANYFNPEKSSEKSFFKSTKENPRKPGESLSEELCMSRKKINKSLEEVRTHYKEKSDLDSLLNDDIFEPFKGKPFYSWVNKKDHKTYYVANWYLIKNMLNEQFRRAPENHKVGTQKAPKQVPKGNPLLQKWVPKGNPLLKNQVPKGNPLLQKWVPKGNPLLQKWVPKGSFEYYSREHYDKENMYDARENLKLEKDEFEIKQEQEMSESDNPIFKELIRRGLNEKQANEILAIEHNKGGYIRTNISSFESYVKNSPEKNTVSMFFSYLRKNWGKWGETPKRSAYLQSTSKPYQTQGEKPPISSPTSISPLPKGNPEGEAYKTASAEILQFLRGAKVSQAKPKSLYLNIPAQTTQISYESQKRHHGQNLKDLTPS